jgi:hypothetical protein
MPKFAANLHIRVGPGPIDLFATRFNNLFEDDVTCTVNGEQIEGGKEGLKQVILGYKEKGLIIEDTQVCAQYILHCNCGYVTKLSSA